MKPKLALSLAGARLLLEVAPPAAPAGLHGLLRSFPFFGNSRTRVAPQKVQAPALVSILRTNDLRSNLDEAISELRIGCEQALEGHHLEVQLGLDHARIGLLVLKDVSATTLSAATRESYVRAWVAQMLHLDPQTQVIRWQVLADPYKLLISCVDRQVFEVLSEFANRQRLQFVSCRPAVLSAMHLAATPGLTVAWTEAGAEASRSGSVQLLRFEGTQLSATWRGWVPVSTDEAGNDSELKGAIRRFQAHHRVAAGDALKRLHWPEV